MIIGAGMQLVYLGVTSTPGGNVPSDPALAARISIPIAVKPEWIRTWPSRWPSRLA